MLEADWPTPDLRLASFNLSRLPKLKVTLHHMNSLASSASPCSNILRSQPQTQRLPSKVHPNNQQPKKNKKMSFLTSFRPTFSSLSSSSSALRLRTTRPFATSPAPRLARMTIVGRLADAPELVATSSGQDVVRYALGTSHGPRDSRQTSWWKVACFMPEGPARDLVLGLGKG